MQDATAQMALYSLCKQVRLAECTSLQYMQTTLYKLVVGADKDLQEAENKNNEVYQFLQSVSNKYGIDSEARSWDYPPSSIENYAFLVV